MLKFLGPHYFQTLWWTWFMFGMMIDIGLKLYTVPSPAPYMTLRSRSWIFMLKFCDKVFRTSLYPNLWCIWFMSSLIIDTGPKCYAVTSPFPPQYMTFKSRPQSYNFYVKFLQCQFLQSLWWILFLFGMNRYKILKCFRKEKRNFRRAVLSGNSSHYY